MPNQKSKENAIKLLSQNIDPNEVAGQTGYSLRRIYDFKKELEKTQEQPTDEATDIAPLQLQSTPARNAHVEAKLEKALDTLLEHLQREVSTDVIEGILKITEALNSLRNPTVNIAEFINEDTPNETGTPVHTEDDAGQDPTGTSADAENFVDILEKTSTGTKTTD